MTTRYEMTVRHDDGSVATIGDAFVAILNAWLTPDEMTLVRQRNASEQTTGICHSHDFCDANEAMLRAFFKTVGSPFDDEGQMTEEAVALWNAAWDHARVQHLTGETSKRD